MNFYFEPYVRYIAKTTYFIDNKFVVANDCRILYIISGSGSFECGGKKYSLIPNTLIYYPYGKPYRIKSDNEMLFYTLNFDFNTDNKDINTMIPQNVDECDFDKIIQSISDDLYEVFNSVILIDDAIWAEKYFRNIYYEGLEKKSSYEELQGDFLKIILIYFYRNFINDNNTDDSISELCFKIKELISKDSNLNNKSIANFLGYHPFYLNDIFKKKEGITLHKYILQQRLIKAYELINITDKTLEEIADLCGFSSQSHLSSAFKKEYGITPGKLRLSQ